MHTEKREDPIVELGYEVRDLNTVAIRNATIGFFIFAVLSAVLGFIAYRFMNPSVFDPKPPTNRVIPGAPFPMLQSTTGSKTDIMAIRQHETEVLNAPPGWVDAAQTHIHIPIEKAMEIIAEKGLAPTGVSVPAVSKGHTPDAAIGEKPAAPATAQTGPLTGTKIPRVGPGGVPPMTSPTGETSPKPVKSP